MSHFELLVSDIDGTLIPLGGDPAFSSKPTRASFDVARAQGKEISLATARPVAWLGHEVEEYGITTPVIVNNGARIADPSNGSTLWERPLPAGAADQIKAFLGELASSKTMRVGLDTGTPALFESVVRRTMEDSVYFDLIGIGDPDEAEAIVDFVEGLGGTRAAAIASPQLRGGFNILITHKEGTKYHGMKALQEILGLEQGQTLAAGNDVNDIPLLEAAGMGAAVSDSHPGLLEVADIIIPNPYQYGVAQLVHDHMLVS